MKKYSWILALLLALTMAFVFVGCKTNSSDDDDDDDDGGNVTPGEYTISFDLDGGTIDGEATFAPIKVKAGSSVGAAKWPTDPDRGLDTFEGWFEGATEYTATTAINKNVTVKAKWTAYVPLPWPDPLLSEEDIPDLHWLGEYTYENPPNQLGWFFGGDGDDYAFTDDTWLLIETKAANGANMNGFGGLQLTFIDSDKDTGKSEKNVNPGWTAFTKGADEILYWAIKLSKHTGYEDFKTEVGTDGFNIYLGYYPFAELGFQNAYLTDYDLSKIDTGLTTASGNKVMDLTNETVNYGLIVTAKGDGIDWSVLTDTTFYAVNDITYTGVSSGLVSIPLTLSASVDPSTATNKTIVWTVKSGSASISGSVLTASAAGNIVVTATIADGKSVGVAFTKDITIPFIELAAAAFTVDLTDSTLQSDNDDDWEYDTDGLIIKTAFDGQYQGRTLDLTGLTFPNSTTVKNYTTVSISVVFYNALDAAMSVQDVWGYGSCKFISDLDAYNAAGYPDNTVYVITNVDNLGTINNTDAPKGVGVSLSGFTTLEALVLQRDSANSSATEFAKVKITSIVFGIE